MKRILFSSLFLLLFSFTHAQQWKNYTAADVINCFAFDGDTVWIGSDGGVAKYLTDGTRLATYTKAEGLIANNVTSIAIDSLGNKWFVSGGVSKFDGTNWTNYNSYNSGLSSSVTSVLIDKKNDKWFDGYYEFDGINWFTYPSVDSALVHGFCPLIDSHGNTWYCSGTELIKFNDTTLTHYAFPSVVSKIGYFKGCLIDSHNNLWLYGETDGPGTTGGLFKFDGTNWSDYSDSIASVSVMAIDNNDNLWLDGGSCIYKFDSAGLSTICNSYQDSSLAPYTTSLSVDAQNNLWVGSMIYAGRYLNSYPTKNVWKYNGTDWLYISPYNSPLNANYVGNIATDHHNNVWVTSGTVYKIADTSWTTNDCITEAGFIDNQNNIWSSSDNATITSIIKFDGTNCFSYNDLLIPADVISIAVDQQGVVWCAVFGGPDQGDILTFNGTNWNNVYQPSDNNTGALEVFVDKQNNKWIGTWSGVVEFDGTNWKWYTPSNSGLPDTNITAIAQDTAGNMWFGTFRNGVAKFDGANWTDYNASNSGLAGDEVDAMLIDKNGIKWFGTTSLVSGYCSGVTRFDGINWTNYNNGNSNLSDNCIASISIDEQGNAWFGTNNGGLSELLNADTTFAVWLQFNGNICSDSTITLNPLINSGHPPYSYSWQANGNSLSCYDCQNPSASVTQNSTFIVQITDSTNATVTDTLAIYACGAATGIKEISSNNASLSIYPSPFATDISVNLHQENLKQTTFTILDMLGQTVYTKQATNLLGNYTNTFNLSNLPNGIYFFEIVSDNEKIVKEIVKQ